MRASPAFRIEIRRHGLWRGAVVVVMLTALGVQLGWLAALRESLPMPAWAALAALDAALLAAASTALRVPAVVLRWDTRQWLLQAADRGEVPAVPGRLAVALDLGAWLLLRFEPDVRSGTRRRWLPVQRRGLEPHWHALRCTVYSARFASGRDAGAAPGAGSPLEE